MIESGVSISANPRPAILKELAAGGAGKLRPGETNDRSAPVIDSDVSIKKNERPQLLGEISKGADVEVGVRIAQPRVAILRSPAWQHERPAEGACESDCAFEAAELVAHAGKGLVDEEALTLLRGRPRGTFILRRAAQPRVGPPVRVRESRVSRVHRHVTWRVENLRAHLRRLPKR